MATLPQLTEHDVRRWVGEVPFERGRRYFQRGHILDPAPPRGHTQGPLPGLSPPALSRGGDPGAG